MKSIFSRVAETQQKLNKSLRKEDLQNLYGKQEGNILWDKYRKEKRDLWLFFQKISSEKKKKLKAWIDTQLDIM